MWELNLTSVQFILLNMYYGPSIVPNSWNKLEKTGE